MTTHKRTGPPVAELVVRIYEPDYYACLTGDCPHWKQVECDAAMASFCPYRPGDVVEFWPACADCDTQASCVGDATVVQSGEVRTINDVPLCPEHCAVFGRKVCEDIIPSLRTVTRVEVRERDGWEWVVFLSEKEG